MTRYRYVVRPPYAPPRPGPVFNTRKEAEDSAIEAGQGSRSEAGDFYSALWTAIEPLND